MNFHDAAATGEIFNEKIKFLTYNLNLAIIHIDDIKIYFII